MIRTFKDPDAERRFNGETVRAGWQNVQVIVERKLLYLHAAVRLADLRSPPGNRLETLKGDRAGSTPSG